MKVLLSKDVTDTTFISSSVAESAIAAWSASTVYFTGWNAVIGHRVYQSVINNNVGNDPRVTPDKWLDCGPTNGWAMFDSEHSSGTVTTSSLSVTLNLGTVSDIVLTGVVGSTVTITVGGSTIRTAAVPAIVPPLKHETLVLTGLGITGQFTLTLTGSGTISICNLSAGAFYEVGTTPGEVEHSVIDYSFNETDQFGTTSLRRRKYSRHISCTLDIPNSGLTALRAVLGSLHAKVCYWHVSDTFDVLNAFCQLKDASVVLDGPTTSSYAIQLDSLALDDVDIDPGQAVEGAVSTGLVLDLSQSSQVLPADVTGSVSAAALAAATTTARVLDGGQDVTAYWGLSIVASGCVAAISAAGVVSVSSISTDQAYVQVTASRANYPTLTRRFSLARFRITDLGQMTVRAVSAGILSTGAAPATPGLYVNGQFTNGLARSYNLFKIHRVTKAVTAQSFDVFGSGLQAQALAQTLNATGSDYVVVVVGYDEPRNNRMSMGLMAAMYRCGASPAVFGSAAFKYRGSYVLVGVPGCGQGNGTEAYRGDADDSTSAWCEISFTLLGSDIAGISSSSTPVQQRGNLVDSSWWSVGVSPDSAGWPALSGGTNVFQMGVCPDGSAGPLWTVTSTQAQNEGGGWDPGGSNAFIPDVSKTYRFIVPVFIPDTKARSVYWGILGNTVCSLNTTSPFSNPYFAVGSSLAPGWYLFVGYVFPRYSTGMTNDGAGVYRLSDGALVYPGTNWCWAVDPQTTGTRAYQFYQNLVGAQLQFDKPSAEICDGSERSLAAVLASGSASARNPATTGMIAANAVSEASVITVPAGSPIPDFFLEITDTSKYLLEFEFTGGTITHYAGYFKRKLYLDWQAPGQPDSAMGSSGQYWRGATEAVIISEPSDTTSCTVPRYSTKLTLTGQLWSNTAGFTSGQFKFRMVDSTWYDGPLYSQRAQSNPGLITTVYPSYTLNIRITRLKR